MIIVLVRIIGVCEHWSGRSSSTKALEGWFVNITTIIRLSAISPLLMCMCFVFLSWSLHSTLISTKWVLKVEHLQTSLVRATTTTSFPPPLSSLANSHPNPTKVDHFNTHLCVCNGDQLLGSAKTIADTIAANRRSSALRTKSCSTQHLGFYNPQAWLNSCTYWRLQCHERWLWE